MKKTLISMAAIAGIIFSACKKETTTTNTPGANDYNVSVNGKIVTVKNLDADTVVGVGAQGGYGVGRYTFFSLSTNSKVSNTDSATSNWDLAFAGNVIRVNCGTSGPGNGGAFVYTAAFDNVTSVPADSTFKIDNFPNYAITKSSGKGWYTYDGPNNIITAIPGRTIIVQTATGKYAKVEIMNYYKGGVTPAITDSPSVKIYNSRYYTFRYTYQADGTKNF